MNINSLLKNINSDGKNSKYFKEKERINFRVITIKFDYPLKKQNKLYQNILTPKVSIKI